MAKTRYEITGVIGRGGFGTVYRARLFGNHGFERDVAIKLLKEIEPDAEVLGRFRDEARLLGQIRHPNIPGVGPPVRLGPNWAVIMDLVEGRDCLRLLRDLERLPVRVVLEIGAEVSRTLHHLHEFKNTPEDTTLKLIHRDIKPSNIMVTRRGTISLLDFGIAKAEFANRETFTTNTVGGTIGYIPPERIQGIDGPAGDVYSLGVVMHALITGKKPSQFTEPDEPIPTPEDLPRTPAIEAAIGLAAEMRRLNPSDRPTALEVARRCEDLARELEGPGLRDWAHLVVTRNTSLEPDDRVGSTLFDGDDGDDDDSLILVLAPSPLRWIAPLAAVLIGVLALGIWWSLPGGPTPQEVAMAAAPEPTLEPKPLKPEPQPATPEPQPLKPEPQPLKPEPLKPEPLKPEPQPLTLEPLTLEPLTPDPLTQKPEPQPGLIPDPDPVPHSEPLPQPLGPKGTVSLEPEGLTAWLQNAEGKQPLRNAPPGTYSLYVVFNDNAVHAATVTLTPGATLRLRCNSRFRKCVP